MDVTAEMIKNLREQSGAGVMSCRTALIRAEGNLDKALAFLKEQNLLQVQKKATRTTLMGLIESYVHAGGRIGVVIEVNCETDFVARTSEFRDLAHNLAMQVAALAPVCVNKDDVPAGSDPQMTSLLDQPYIKDTTKTVQDVINETIAKVGENIKVRRFARFEVGEELK